MRNSMSEDDDVRCNFCGYAGELSEFADDDYGLGELECPDCGAKVVLSMPEEVD